ncbi:MAG: ectonucleotide pyrophosphatase/phosphodiesterase [Acidobacteria bacterium]|nr:ectonucleotide pyrophosphatase/phosphodiesterase [Acidobacteriota bacterium]
MRSSAWVGLFLATMLSVLGCAAGTPTPAVPAAAEPAPGSTLILISLDGFRWDYLDWDEASNLSRLAAAGVRAQGLIPVFPSKTFPCHYSIVTGLYPGTHGIISNNMYDPVIGGEFHLGDRAAVEDTRWWGGEPIWVTAEKQGLKAAAMFWPGTEAEIAGERPSYWHPFDKGFSFGDRVAQVLAWLDLPAAQRPRVITLYFEYPNDVSHHFGPDARETHAAVSEVDGLIGDLLAGLEARGLRESVDLVITSDHGMAEVSIDRVVVLDDYVEFEEGELFEQGAVVQIFPNPGREETIYSALSGAHPQLAIYRKNEIPQRYHLRESSRTAPIIGVPAAGWEAVERRRFEYYRVRMLKGDHGQDPSDPDLHGLFVASGPSFNEGMTIERFESVEIYNLLAAVLELEPAPNDGDPTRWSAVLRR